VDPNPDYDASDELEYFFNWFPWALRGVYPPPAYRPSSEWGSTRHLDSSSETPMNSETSWLRAVLARMLLAGMFAVAAGTAAAAPAAAEPGENPCELALSFVCHFVPIAPDLDHDIDLTQQLSPDGPPSHRRTRCHRRIHVPRAASSRGVGQPHGSDANWLDGDNNEGIGDEGS
jgi:hypothetical protein